MTWSDNDLDGLKKQYPKKGKSWCMDAFNKSEVQVRYMASKLGLKQDRNGEFFQSWQKRAAMSKIGKKRPEQSKVMTRLRDEGKAGVMTKQTRKKISLAKIKWHKENNHPMGFLGHKHSKKSKKKMSVASIRSWKDPSSGLNSEENRQRMSDSMSKRQAENGNMRKGYSRGKMGTYNINGKDVFFRSEWEANYALYLDFLIKQKQIKSWKFESKTFWFEKIKRGVRSYKPDFEVENNDGSIEFHEVKGWMDAKSKTKLKRMRIYHPDVKMVLIDSKPYKEIIKKMSGVIKFYNRKLEK